MSLLSTLLPGVSPLDLFPETRKALAGSLSTAQQVFVSQHMGDILSYLESPEGTAGVKLFVEGWQEFEATKAKTAPRNLLRGSHE